ncbi:hypothetical protein AB0D13_33350 [Streptomyces sp. NPDC048430]|uniref:hypothetical protein n=1 Tax=Streptomyces sp. NPDC048430 TaxID=3155388 RepID=UPI0034478B04
MVHRGRPGLLRALAPLALAQGSDELAARLERLSNPLCMESLDAVLTPSTAERWCGIPVGKKGEPCGEHTPKLAAELGRCTWVGSDDGWAGPASQRICRGTPVSGGDRCEQHAACCRAVKRDRKVCNRVNCTVDKHREASVAAGQ